MGDDDVKSGDNKLQKTISLLCSYIHVYLLMQFTDLARNKAKIEKLLFFIICYIPS